MAKKQVFKVGDTAYLKLKYENILKCQVVSVGERPQGWRRVMKETVTVREILEGGTLNKREWTVWNSRSHILCEEEGKDLYEELSNKRREIIERKLNEYQKRQDESAAWATTPSAKRALRIGARVRIWTQPERLQYQGKQYQWYYDDVIRFSQVLDEEFGPAIDPEYMKDGC